MLRDIPKNSRYLFVDMNSFFARVEQQVQPCYRGQPVGIAPHTGDTGCIIASSYEAKALGIKTGCKVGEAKKIYPKIVILESRPALYHFYHKEIIKVAQKFTPFLKIMSIDEFAIHLTGRDQNRDEAVKMAFALKTAIRKEVGDWLTCSIGIGPNQFLAKIANEYKKPDGLFEISLENMQSIYQNLALTDLTGINYRMERQFNAINVYTPIDLYNRSLPELSRHFGIMGKAWYYRLRGYELDEANNPTKTIGHSHVLPPDLRNYQGVRKVIIKLVEKTGYRLRKDNFWADHISLGIGYYDHRCVDESAFKAKVGKAQSKIFKSDDVYQEKISGEAFGNLQTAVPSCSQNDVRRHAYHFYKVKKIAPCQDNQALLNYALGLFSESPSLKPISVQFSTFGLVQGCVRSISLFGENRKTEQLSRAMDQINDKYGAATIQNASLTGTESVAPDRIPFGRPRFDIRN